MVKALLGRKLGMTQVYEEDQVIPVTVLEVGPCAITDIRTAELNGYEAVQLGFGEVRAKRLTKPVKGQFAKHDLEIKRWVAEVPLDAGGLENAIGDVVDVNLFKEVASVDVIGTSKGRGFAGVIKRHGFSRGPETHGSHNHRAPGSIGACAWPAKVFKGKKMPGHYGDKRKTVKNLQVVRVDSENNLLYVKGAVPGSFGGRVIVRVRS